MTDFDEIAENFAFLDDWEDRYKYLIELGQSLEPLPDALKVTANKVSGCVSQVWVTSSVDKSDDTMVIRFRADSDAAIVKGIVAVLLSLYSGQSADFVRETDAIAELDRIGLREHLTAQRSNGLVAMVKRMREDAARLAG